MIAYNSSVYVPTYFFQYTCIMSVVGLYTELLYAIILLCFPTFCHSATPTIYVVYLQLWAEAQHAQHGPETLHHHWN